MTSLKTCLKRLEKRYHNTKLMDLCVGIYFSLKWLKEIFLTTKSIRIVGYVFIVQLYGLLGKFIPLFQKKYIKKASKFKDSIVNTKHGTYLCSNFHDLLMTQNDYEPDIHNVIKKIGMKKNDYLINIGANVGRRAIACAKDYNYNVIAFEPVPETYRRLKINVLLSNLENKIETYNIGLGDKNQTMKFDYIPQWNGSSKIIQDDKKVEGNIIEVPVKKFDDLGIDKEKIDKTRLIIMDVEGFEFSVIKGMEKTLKEFNNINIIMEIRDSEKTKEDTINFMKKLGYSIEQIDNSNYLFSK